MSAFAMKMWGTVTGNANMAARFVSSAQQQGLSLLGGRDLANSG